MQFECYSCLTPYLWYLMSTIVIPNHATIYHICSLINCLSMPPPPPPTAQYGSYYLAPALSYQPTTAAATAGPAPAPPTPVSTGGSQIALPSVPHPPAYFYGGYTYPYTPGRIVAPILALGKFSI